MLCRDASRLFLYHPSKHLSSVLGRTELCHEVRNPGPQKTQIIRNENHHLALSEIISWWAFSGTPRPAFTPMYIDHVSGKAPFPGQGVWWIQKVFALLTHHTSWDGHEGTGSGFGSCRAAPAVPVSGSSSILVPSCW